MVCQAHFMQKKSPKTREKFDHIVIFFIKTIMVFLETKDKWFVITIGVVVYTFDPRLQRP
jgi:hypothetical protein